MKTILKLTISFFAAFALAACADDIIDFTGDIQGTIRDYDGGELLENCRVSLLQSGMSISTDANGSFAFEDVQPGSYSLTFSKSGYSDQSQDVAVIMGQTTRVNIFLKKQSSTKGEITGLIRDYDNGQPISNCSVSLSPGGLSKISSSSGAYQFSDLTPGEYTLTFTKAGYDNATNSVVVHAGKNTTVDILLKARSSFALSDASYDFGDLEVSKTFYFFNNSDESCSFEVSNIPNWLSFSQTVGTVSSSNSLAVTATVNRSGVPAGDYSQNILISYSGKVSGTVTLAVRMKKVVLSAPSVSIASAAENVTQNSFEINGNIIATGGSQVTDYGHCWNTTGNPTINDSKTDMGTTSAICSFKSTAANLAPYTKYYVKAYAKNAQGITYSDQVTIMTQDLASNKWDGNMATSFAGGSGTYIDPYIIKTGGQLLRMKTCPDKYFELASNIDLDNINWLPFEFKGNLDGKNYTVSNLYVDRIEPYQGLFSECSGFVSNLNVRNVYIKAGALDYIGAISGSGGTITNCKVILGSSSLLVGDQYVGGISGHNAKITDCSVESDAASAVIKGNSYVGGLIGNCSSDITNSHVSCKLMGTNYVGGVVGCASSTIQSCSFTGGVTGENGVGGICGNGSSYTLNVKGCKVQASLEASNGAAGGILGTSHEYSKIYGCYAAGTLSASGNASGIAYSSSVYLSYSVMTSSSSSYYGIGHKAEGKDCAATASRASGYGDNFKANCTDITTFLRECYSEYAGYWNFNKNWMSGDVKCPKLSWEQ